MRMWLLKGPSPLQEGQPWRRRHGAGRYMYCMLQCLQVKLREQAREQWGGWR